MRSRIVSIMSRCAVTASRSTVGPWPGMIFVVGPAAPIKLPQAREHAVHRAAVRAIDIRKLNRAEEVARHQNVILHEADHRVAVGVRVADRDQFDVLAIHVERDHAVIGHRRQRERGSRSAGSAIRSRSRMRQSEAQLIARQQRRAQLGEILIAARVIADAGACSRRT